MKIYRNRFTFWGHAPFLSSIWVAFNQTRITVPAIFVEAVSWSGQIKGRRNRAQAPMCTVRYRYNYQWFCRHNIARREDASNRATHASCPAPLLCLEHFPSWYCAPWLPCTADCLNNKSPFLAPSGMPSSRDTACRGGIGHIDYGKHLPGWLQGRSWTAASRDCSGRRLRIPCRRHLPRDTPTVTAVRGGVSSPIALTMLLFNRASEVAASAYCVSVSWSANSNMASASRCPATPAHLWKVRPSRICAYWLPALRLPTPF